ncbi:hypothetical protein EII34_10945 [Arachnia propionica]|uniref:Uncharacterized protein n=1 Tax=Arachnia propionica TaxID=1750 RepID=A0A3P1T3L7_9ACTN|nr:hypothetical protein [Arachnia propionica]RRD04117.1 hypothetical protein EII34_10945 [Arachnia propionica]
MIINTDGLKNWPDGVAIFEAAAALVEHGAGFSEDIDTARHHWLGLTACYNSPHQELMYSALDSAQTSGNQASDGCLSVSTAMTLFGDAIATLRAERSSLLHEVVRHHERVAPEDPVELAAYNEEGTSLQGRVNDLTSKYRNAIEECRDKLQAIGNDGLPEKGHPAWLTLTGEQVCAVAGAFGDAAKVDITKVTSRFVFHVGEVPIKIPFWVSHNRHYHMNWGSAPKEGSFLERFFSNMKSAVLGPEIGKYGAPEVIREPKGRIGLEKTKQIRHATTLGGRILGRSMFVVGTTFTFVDEYAKADRKLREQRPELTESERKAEVAETGTVRAASEVLASVSLGAAAGATIGGPVGVIAGLGVGLIMAIPTGEDRTVGDLAGDVGEWIWSGLKEIFK